ncbi:hypothetical protein T484DRAFT_1755853 [Baffinella frigidus]|nr:hypothetical protein T484DRAFT_1755853 [Cryptophyta sp. CCMP2293]
MLAVAPTSSVSSHFGVFFNTILQEIKAFNLAAWLQNRQAGLYLLDSSMYRARVAIEAFAAKLEADWREFLVVSEQVVDQYRKGHMKRCANAMAIMVIDELGPPPFLALLLSEFKVSANLKDSKRRTLLEKAFESNQAWYVEVLVTGHKKNKACLDDYGRINTKPFIPPVYKQSYPGKKGCLLSAVSMKADRHFDTLEGAEVDSISFVVKTLLGNGASLYYYDNAERTFDAETAYKGWSTWCHVAKNGNVDTMKSLLKTGTKTTHAEHMNDTYTVTKNTEYCPMHTHGMTPLLFVQRHDNLHGGGVRGGACPTGKCRADNCNMPMVALFVENGANPHMCALKDDFDDGMRVVRPVHIDLCEGGRALLGLLMYERVQRHRVLVILSFQKARQPQGYSKSFPEEILKIICKLAGIGTPGMNDAKIPWVPTMPTRTQDPLCYWYGAYTEVDAAVARMRAKAFLSY